MKLDCSGKEISHVLFPHSTAESPYSWSSIFQCKFYGAVPHPGATTWLHVKGWGKKENRVREGKLCWSVL